MFTHKKCNQEVQAKSIVHEYAPITILSQGYIETGDVEGSSIEDTVVWCETCGAEVPQEDVAGE